MKSEMVNTLLSAAWAQHVLPTNLNHLLVSDTVGDGSQLTDLALRIAAPSAAEVTLCCRRPLQRAEKAGSGAHSSAAYLREKGLTVFVNPAGASELQGILFVDGSRSIDLIIMREHEPYETADWHTAASVKIVRRVQRPVISCGPFFIQNQNNAQGPVVAAVSMRESSRQIAHAAGRLAKIMGGPLTILHTVDPEHELSRPDNLAGVDSECRLLAGWISAHETDATAQIAYGPSAEAITRFAVKANASLIVIGVDIAEGGQEAQRSDTLRRNVLMGAPCPVLLVPTLHSTKHINVDGPDADALDACDLLSRAR